MDKLKLYQDAVIGLLEKYVAIKPENLPNIEQHLLADRMHNHFAFIRLGWNDDHFIYQCVIHFDIKDDKIWLQHNQTDQNLIEELQERGVNPQDITIGFIPPYARSQPTYEKA